MFLVLLLCVLWCGYMYYNRRIRNASLHKLPPVYPGALPIIGHTHLLLYWAKDLFSFVSSMSQFCMESGGVTCGYFVGDIYYGVVDPDDAVTVSCSLLQKHPMVYKFGKSWVGQGMITGAGALYKHHRRLLSPAFSLPVIYGFLNVFNEQAKRLNKIFESHIGQGPFDTVEIFKNITLRTTCITVFGDNDEKDNEFLEKYFLAVDDVMITIKDRVLRPWLHNDFIYGFSNLKKKHDKQVQEIDRTSYAVIQRKRMAMKNKANDEIVSESDRIVKPFIDIILEIAADGSLSDQEIRDELNTTVVASYESTSQQLIFISVLLGSHPEVQDKIYEEILRVVGDKDVEKEDLPKLVYTEAVIKECLRMIPAIPLLPRYVDRDLKLKNYTLRAGSYVFFMPGGIHQHKAWGPDPEVFRPERWLDNETASKLANLSFAFSYGPRSCIGRKYAMISIKIALVHMIRQFRLEADVTKMKFKLDCLTRPASGHEITVKRRNEKHDLNQNIISTFVENNACYGI